MKPSFTKGQPIRASDLNALADMACSNIIGGRGCAVTRLGKKIVVSQRPSQSLQRGSLYGNVWKLSAASGRVKWGFDTGGEAYSVCAAPNGTVYVVGERNNDWSDGGDYANVWKLSSSGSLIWGVDLGTSDDAHEVQATNDAVFVGYYDSAPKIAKLDPDDGSVLATVGVLYGSAVNRHGFAINSTQLWTWSTVSSAQGLRAYDHDLSSIYSVTPPQTGLVDIAWGIGASDDLVALGTAYSLRFGALGITNDTLAVISASTSPVTQFVVAETASASSAPIPYEIHGNVDCEENYIAAAYFAEEGNRATADKRISIARLYDTGGTRLHDIWLSLGNTGGAGENNDIAVDESANLFFYASELSVAYMEGVLIDGAAENLYRGLFAFDIDTGAITWKWSPSAVEGSGGQNGLLSVFADRNGHVYTTALTSREPFMKVGD
ncbi:MAG: hypothetical protein IT366_21530 [Candidatus Hydrogenedentes bacterium]|nr:hypothetical protein [Candidatus Hydrogenedentota bacterium]